MLTHTRIRIFNTHTHTQSKTAPLTTTPSFSQSDTHFWTCTHTHAQSHTHTYCTLYLTIFCSLLVDTDTCTCSHFTKAWPKGYVKAWEGKGQTTWKYRSKGHLHRWCDTSNSNSTIPEILGLNSAPCWSVIHRHTQPVSSLWTWKNKELKISVIINNYVHDVDNVLNLYSVDIYLYSLLLLSL